MGKYGEFIVILKLYSLKLCMCDIDNFKRSNGWNVVFSKFASFGGKIYMDSCRIVTSIDLLSVFTQFMENFIFINWIMHIKVQHFLDCNKAGIHDRFNSF